MMKSESCIQKVIQKIIPEIMINYKADKVMKKLFHSLKNRY